MSYQTSGQDSDSFGQHYYLILFLDGDCSDLNFGLVVSTHSVIAACFEAKAGNPQF